MGLVAASYLCLNALDLLLFNFPAVMVIMAVGFRFTTGMNWKQAVYGGGTCSINAYCFRGIFTVISAFIYRDRDFLYDANAYYIVTLFALPASLLLLALFRKRIIPDEKLKKLLHNDGQLNLIITYELAAVINLVVINSGRFQSSSSTWYMEIALGACTLTLFMLIYAIHQSIHGTELLEYQWKTKTLEDQYQRQLQHYKSYQKYTESFRAFRHDYQFMMGTLKSLLQANDMEKAVQLLEDVNDEMQEKVQMHQKYSDNLTLDAMLQDLANICEEKRIRFSFHVSMTRKTNLTLLDGIRIFSNIANNAVEACEKVPESKRFIEITSGHDQQWVMLEVVNSYDGCTTVQDGKLVTTKQDKAEHGLGLGIVREITEDMGGFVIYDADQKSKSFLTRVHIPFMQDKQGGLL